jgi:hypothetical protein
VNKTNPPSLDLRLGLFLRRCLIAGKKQIPVDALPAIKGGVRVQFRNQIYITTTYGPYLLATWIVYLWTRFNGRMLPFCGYVREDLTRR